MEKYNRHSLMLLALVACAFGVAIDEKAALENNLIYTPNDDHTIATDAGKHSNSTPLKADRLSTSLGKQDDSNQNSAEYSDDYYENYDYDYYTDDISRPVTTEKSVYDRSNKNFEGHVAERISCPRDCICQRNVNRFIVATCMRLDPDVQHFGKHITDLVVVNVSPKYPIMLDDRFFVKIGLTHVSSIRIFNCTIQNIHPNAFTGLNELYSVNFTDVNLNTIHPDTFSTNNALRLLKIAGNDLSGMSRTDSIFKHYILKVPNLEELDLSRNNIGELLPTAFTELKNIVYINLSHNNLKKLPEHVFQKSETLEELDLSYNQFKRLPENIFNQTALKIINLRHNNFSNNLKFINSDVQQLDLTDCNIRIINNNLFKGMTGINKLHLRGNHLHTILQEAFSHLPNLRYLDLSFNDLEQIPSLAFYRNSNLQVLKLNDNAKLSQLPLEGFYNRNGLDIRFLDVSNCAIGELGSNVFSQMTNLTILRMAWNNINNLNSEIFYPLSTLLELDLSNNLIEKLSSTTFISNSKLRKLNLSGNTIKKLPQNIFATTPKLEQLDVSDCEIESLSGIPQTTLANQLLFLNVSHNQIKKISKSEILKFKTLNTLDISNNPIKCNKDFKKLVTWLNQSGIVPGMVPRSLSFPSSFPNRKYEQNWHNLESQICIRETTFNIDDADNKAENISKEDIYYDDDDDDDVDEPDNNADDTDEVDEEDETDDDDDGDDYDSELKYDEGVPENVGTKNVLDGMLEDHLSEMKKNNNDEEHSTIIYTYTYSYQELWPIVLFILGLLLILAGIINIIVVLRRKRGERYRQAILASKSSIVYQKLSEDIPAPRKGKRHAYAPVHQV